jgi:hypothetical protein
MFYRLDADAANQSAALADITNHNGVWANLPSTIIFQGVHLSMLGHSVFRAAQFLVHSFHKLARLYKLHGR